jgi:hypothetical protein
MHRKRRILHEEASSFFELLAETIALPVIPNTYPGAHKAARPPSSRLRRGEQRLSQDRVPRGGKDEDRVARTDHLKLAHCPRSLAATLAALPSMSLNPFAPLYLARSRSARPLPRGLTGHVAHPSRSIETRSLRAAPFSLTDIDQPPLQR